MGIIPFKIRFASAWRLSAIFWQSLCFLTISWTELDSSPPNCTRSWWIKSLVSSSFSFDSSSLLVAMLFRTRSGCKRKAGNSNNCPRQFCWLLACVSCKRWRRRTRPNMLLCHIWAYVERNVPLIRDLKISLLGVCKGRSPLVKQPIAWFRQLPVRANDSCEKNNLHFNHSYRCEEEYVVVNLVRNHRNQRALSGAVAPTLNVEGLDQFHRCTSYYQ